jgi:hypothetical protein
MRAFGQGVAGAEPRKSWPGRHNFQKDSKYTAVVNNGILTLEAWPTEIWVTTGEDYDLLGLLLEIVPRSFFRR